MNPHSASRERWLQLIDAHLAGTISDDEARELEAVLRDRRAAREDFRRLCNLDAALRREAAMQPEPAVASSKVRRSRITPVHWAAAAGLVFGLFCATMAWAAISQKMVATMERVFALVDGSFEGRIGPVPSGFPKETGLWSGDASEIVSGESKARDGGRMLRFVRAAGDANVPGSPATSCDVWQLVDLRGMRGLVKNGEAMLEASASFLDARKAKGERLLLSVRVYAFAGDPARLHAEWPMAIKEALAFGSGGELSWGGTSEQWRSVTAKTVLPENADFAIVQLVATGWSPPGQASEFGAQYADDVRLTLKTQPKLPVRITQR